MDTDTLIHPGTSLFYKTWEQYFDGPRLKVIKQTMSINLFELLVAEFRWTDGEPICVPWKFSEQAANGECFKSHIEHRYDIHGTMPCMELFHYLYRHTSSDMAPWNCFHYLYRPTSSDTHGTMPCMESFITSQRGSAWHCYIYI